MIAGAIGNGDADNPSPNSGISGAFGRLPGSRTPVAIKRHGSMIGIYIPKRPKPSPAELEALRLAGEQMQELLAASGTTEDEIVAEFERVRRERREQTGQR